MSQTRSRSKGAAAAAAGRAPPPGGELSPTEPEVLMSAAGPEARGKARTKKTRVRDHCCIAPGIRPGLLEPSAVAPAHLLHPSPSAGRKVSFHSQRLPFLSCTVLPSVQLLEQTTQEQELPGGDQLEIREVRWLHGK